MVKIIGIDPSLTGCGLALIEDGKLVKSLLVSTPADWTRGRRLSFIAVSVGQFYTDTAADIVAMEGYAFGSKFSREEMGEVGGAIKFMLYDMDVEPVIWPNYSWKQATLGKGKGQTKKEDLKLPIFQKYGVEIKDMNELEAYCVALAEHLAQADPTLRPVPKKPKGKKK